MTFITSLVFLNHPDEKTVFTKKNNTSLCFVFTLNAKQERLHMNNYRNIQT